MRHLLVCSLFLCAAALGSIASPSPAQTGACCFCGGCAMLQETDCTDQGGSYLGDGTSCEECPLIVPDPVLCEVSPADALQGIFFCPSAPVPHPASSLSIEIIANACPISDALVTITMMPETPFCDGELTWSGVTDENGFVVIPLAGGGCLDETPEACVIKASGVTIRLYENVKSPDFDGDGGDGSVGLRDLVAFAQEFVGMQPAVCHDYDNNGNVGLEDLVLFSPAFVNVNHCP